MGLDATSLEGLVVLQSWRMMFERRDAINNLPEVERSGHCPRREEIFAVGKLQRQCGVKP